MFIVTRQTGMTPAIAVYLSLTAFASVRLTPAATSTVAFHESLSTTRRLSLRFRGSPRPLSTIGIGTVTCLLDFQVHVARDYASPCALLAEHVFSYFGVDPYGLVLMVLAVLCHPP